MLPETLGVIGLGSLGGSVAWQAARSGVRRIVGYAESTRDGVAAVRAGAITEFVHDASTVVRTSNLIVLAVPPRATLDLLRRLTDLVRERRAYWTDVTSVKGPVVALAEELGLATSFAGSHPLVGSQATGFAGAHPDRLNGAVVYVTPLAAGERAAAEIGDFWSRGVGAHPVTIPVEQHDALVAWTSHLPQVVASALAATLATHGPAGVTYARSAIDLTQSARGPSDQWAELMLMNRQHLLRALDGLAAGFGTLRQALADNDRAALERWLRSAAEWRARFDS